GILGGSLALMAALWALFRFTRLGRAMRAVAQNQRAARLMGISVERVYSTSWVLAGVVGAVAGVLVAPVVFLSSTMGLIVINGFTAAVIGGFGPMPGAVVGGMFLGVLENLAPLYLPSGIRYSVPFVVLGAVPVVVTLLLAGAFTAAVGLAFGVPCLRLGGLYLSMATLAFGFVITEAILNLDTLTKGADGLRVPVLRLGGFGALGDTGRYYLTAVTAALMVAAAVNLVRTRTGRAFLAIRESEIAAQASGVPVAAYKTAAFGLSAFYTGVAGGLFAFVVGFLSPDAFDVFLSVDFVVMIVVGGLGSVPGSIIGAAVVTVLYDWLAAFQNYRPLIFGAILIACMLFMPGGIVRALARSVTWGAPTWPLR